jgi:hypothetical protein
LRFLELLFLCWTLKHFLQALPTQSLQVPSLQLLRDKVVEAVALVAARTPQEPQVVVAVGVARREGES